MIFQKLLVFLCFAGLAGGSPIENLTLIFFVVFKKIFLENIIVTCDQQEKVLSSQNLLLWILQIRYLIWMYAELNRLLVGSGLVPLNIELQQDDRTVCCSHKAAANYYQDTCVFFLQKLLKKYVL